MDGVVETGRDGEREEMTKVGLFEQGKDGVARDLRSGCECGEEMMGGGIGEGEDGVDVQSW